MPPHQWGAVASRTRVSEIPRRQFNSLVGIPGILEEFVTMDKPKKNGIDKKERNLSNLILNQCSQTKK